MNEYEANLKQIWGEREANLKRMWKKLITSKVYTAMYNAKGIKLDSFAILANFVSSEANFTEAKFGDTI